MKLKRIAILLASVLLCLCLALSACVANPDADNTDGEGSNTEQDVGSEEGEEITEMYITVNGNKLKVKLAANSAVDALVGILKEGDITYTAHANDFEIYGDIGHNLGTSNNAQITSEAGDVLLYIGSNICIFFDNNSWSYTKIGKIEGYTATELKSMLAPSSTVRVTIGLE